MKTAKILSLIGTVIYSYFVFKPPFSLGVFGKILSQFNQSIQPVTIGILWTTIIAAILNLAFLIFMLFKEANGLKETRARFISLLLLIMPLLIMYILYAMVANKVYNLG